MTAILWLASYPKSGNTWLRAFLSNYIADTGRAIDINALPKHAYGDMLAHYYEQVSGKPATKLAAADIHRLRPMVHRFLAGAHEGLILVKTHTAIARLGGTPTITPEVTFGAIYLVRDPLDVAVSFAHHWGLSLDAAVAALCDKRNQLPSSPGILPQYVSSWGNHIRTWHEAPGLRQHTIRYEDLIAAPGPTFGAVVDFLKMPRDRPRLKRAIRHSAFKTLARQEAERGFKERPQGMERFFRKGAVGEGRETLNDEQIRRLVSAHREAMVKFGYLSSDDEPVD